jgi:glycosyltransferase involved in cell wall biosynthesis
MKILHVSTLSSGGAFNAAYRLHEGLLETGFDSTFLTLKENQFSGGINFPAFGKYGLSLNKRLLNKVGIQSLKSAERARAYKNLGADIEAFSSPNTDYQLGKYIIDHIKPDIINLHWCANFIDYEEFFGSLNLPVVWTLHDEQPFSAYWHYSNDRLDSKKAKEIEVDYLEIKNRAIEDFENKLTIVAPSQWLLDQSKSSPLFQSHPHKLIRYGLNANVFKPTKELPKSFSHEQIDPEKIKLLFICQSVSNPRKGMGTLLDALSQLKPAHYQLIAVGEVSPEIQKDLTLDTVFTGSISDPLELAKVYNYCDAMVIPSKQDNLPNTMLESLACGTPVIGTPAGGISEILKNPIFGILSETHDAVDLAKAIRSFSAESFERKVIAELAHQIFDLEKQAKEYTTVYNNLLEDKKV